MFERGRKDGSFSDEAGDRPAQTSSYESPSARTTDRSGEVAVIGRSIKINGDLRGDEDLRIDGDVSGTVQLKNSSLTIGKEGKVKADVYAKAVGVDGNMEGDIYASERVTVRANARVMGNITAPRITIEDGAKFKGSIEMDQEAVDKALGKASLPGSARPGGSRPESGKAPDPKLGPNVVKEAASS